MRLSTQITVRAASRSAIAPSPVLNRLAAKRALALALWCMAAPLCAADFRSVGEAAILYDAPAVRGKKLYVAPRGMPLEAIVVNEAWVRVRDKSGELTWIERKSLSDKRTVIANASAVVVREQANDGAKAVITVGQDVVLDLVEAPSSGWVKVRHRDGAAGFVAINQVWGL